MKRWIKILFILAFVYLLAYGASRVYYRMTGGFTIGNISYDLPFDARWEIPPLRESEAREREKILRQPFSYLGKGCQSYVFASKDGRSS